jgi:acyl-CoA synthetase (AMP-forming)/AMP-acid ligase II
VPGAADGLAVLHGGPLPEPPVTTLPGALRRAAGTRNGVVLIDAGGVGTWRPYSELYREATAVLGGLQAAGAEPGAVVVLALPAPSDLLTAFWACVLGGLVPLPVPAAGGGAVLADAGAAAGRAWLVADGDPPALPAGIRPLGPVSALGAPGGPGPRPHRCRPDDPALLTLTSGSSGRPKAVPLSHRNVLARSHATALARGLDEGTRTLNWLPLDHVSGMVMFHIRDVFLGCHQVHADTGWVRADPLRWLDLASAERADTTWAPNHAFARVVERLDESGGRQWDLSRLRYVMNGGEAVKDRVARRFLAALAPYGLPATAIHPGWGMPETASGVVDGVLVPHGGPSRRYVPVGVPHPGVSVRVVDDEGRVLPERAVGRLQVTGPPVAVSYLEDGAPHPAPLTADGWLVTDDLAFVDGGELTVTGRADDVIEVGHDRYHGHEMEDAVEELPCVLPGSTVVRAYPGAGGRRALAVFFRPRPRVPGPEAERMVRERLRDRFGARVDHLEALGEHDLPRTPTGKLRKSALTARLPGPHP